jgi:hypothetical protein
MIEIEVLELIDYDEVDEGLDIIEELDEMVEIE